MERNAWREGCYLGQRGRQRNEAGGMARWQYALLRDVDGRARAGNRNHAASFRCDTPAGGECPSRRGGLHATRGGRASCKVVVNSIMAFSNHPIQAGMSRPTARTDSAFAIKRIQHHLSLCTMSRTLL